MSVVGMSIHFGNGTGGLIASFFIDVLNWKWYFYFGGFLLSVGFIMNILFVSKYPGGSLFEKAFATKQVDNGVDPSLCIQNIACKCVVLILCLANGNGMENIGKYPFYDLKIKNLCTFHT